MHYDSNYAFHNNALSKHIIAMNFSYLFKYIVIGDQSTITSIQASASLP